MSLPQIDWRLLNIESEYWVEPSEDKSCVYVYDTFGRFKAFDIKTWWHYVERPFKIMSAEKPHITPEWVIERFLNDFHYFYYSYN